MIRNVIKKEFIISILLHTVIITGGVYQYLNRDPQLIIKNKVKKEPIKSYLYSRPKTSLSNTFKRSYNDPLPFENTPRTETIKSIKKATVKKVNKHKNSKLQSSTKKSLKKTQDDAQLKPKKLITKQSLQAQINNINKNLTYEYKQTDQRTTIKSIFNPTPVLVPRSTTSLPEQTEQKRKQKITSYSSDISISKDEEGNCSLTQDLTSVGIEGVSATQHFKCGGKTKFEKAFSQHMKTSMERYK